MDIGSIFLILGILLLVTLYVSKPLTRRQATIVSNEEQEYSSLLADRDRILKTLQDLDFDYTLGKIPEEQYPSERGELLHRGAAILKKLDEYNGEKKETEIKTQQHDKVDPVQMEATNLESQNIEDDELEILIANRLREREGRSNGFCPQCGHAVQESDRFCPKCGHPLRSKS